jgi:hypothetical protein
MMPAAQVFSAGGFRTEYAMRLAKRALVPAAGVAACGRHRQILREYRPGGADLAAAHPAK